MHSGLAALTLASALAAQEPSRDALDWAIAQTGRHAELRNPVVAAWAAATLADQVCPRDRAAGASIFDQAIARANALPAGAFAERGPRLPVSGFSAMWRLIAAPAPRCDPKFTGLAPSPSLQSSIDEERRRANSHLATARETVESNPDRAAQLASAALDAGDPLTLDFALFTHFLAELRDRAPDLADELFDHALAYAASAPTLRARLLAMLADYLFVAPKLLDRPDKDLERLTLAAAGLTFSDLSATRRGTNPEDISALIESALRAVESGLAADDAPAAYALLAQLLPKAADYVPALADRARAAFDTARFAAGAAASSIDAAIPSAAPNPEGGEASRIRHRLIRAALQAASLGRIADAREISTRVDDQDVRGQLASLIQFAAAGHALQERDVQGAASLANSLRGGVKRALLYAAIIPAAGGDSALQIFHLALRDIEPLPAEHRVALLSALASSMFRVDAESALVALKLAVEASNDAAVRPRRARFNPKLVRAIYRGTGSAPADSGLIVIGVKRTYEAVDDGLGRHSFALRAPGVTVFRIPEAIRAARSVDPARLEAILPGLRDETRRAEAIAALVALRLGVTGAEGNGHR